MAVAIVAGYFYIVFVLLDSPWDNRRFDAELWRDAFESIRTDNPRGEMHDDLLANHLQHGMSLEAVEGLLGPPEYREGRELLRGVHCRGGRSGSNRGRSPTVRDVRHWWGSSRGNRLGPPQRRHWREGNTWGLPCPR